jgi:effector-binding domain-containing protein/uncharacterized protein YndB with AHSA1/START domain
MGMLKKVVLVLVSVVVLLAIVGLALPRQVHVERSTVIEAPRATVFAVLNGFRLFNRWSPWVEADPGARYTYEGPAFGVGSKMTWSGDPKTAGSGSQEIIESRHPESIRTSLDFGDQGKAFAAFTLAPEGTGTKVTWGLDSDLGMNPVGRYFGLMLDRMVGPDYEKGLARLKTFVEGLPKADFAGLDVQEVETTPATVAFIEATSGKDEQSIATAIGGAYAEVGRFLAANRLKQSAPPITINTKWDDTGYLFDAAIPVDRTPEKEISAASRVKIKTTYAGKALKVVHRGAYREMTSTYDRLMAYAAAHGYDHNGAPWDEYVRDPGKTPESDLVTNIYLPVR